MSDTYDPIFFARAQEQIRQEQEAFDQHKSQNERWFILRMAVVSVSTALLLAVVAICFYIFIYHASFPEYVVQAASAAFFGDIVGLLILVWRVVVGTGQLTALTPITRALPDSPGDGRRSG